MPNANAMPIYIATAVPISVAKPLPTLCLWPMHWPISMHKFIHTFAKYNLQMPNANAAPIANANAKPLPRLCPWSISIHKFIHTFAKYNLQMLNTCPLPLLRLCQLPMPMPVPWPTRMHNDWPYNVVHYSIIVVYPDYSIYSIVYSTASTKPVSFVVLPQLEPHFLLLWEINYVKLPKYLRSYIPSKAEGSSANSKRSEKQFLRYLSSFEITQAKSFQSCLNISGTASRIA